MQICNPLLTPQSAAEANEERSRKSNLRAQLMLSGPSIHDFFNSSLALTEQLSYTFLSRQPTLSIKIKTWSARKRNGTIRLT